MFVGFPEPCIFVFMDLKPFWMSMSVAERAAFAVRCGTTFKHLQNVVYGRPCAPELAISIERESGGKVRCESIRPDCSDLFGYLRESGSVARAAA